ncbi:MAG: hypothetical protein CMH91_06955 [Oceanicaulis sp.]|jgi:hypothetical protein|uniref:hypothetical protein n=1 Tax=unclassified Oceanicaulis TaxID=2632123 RepID=UPI0000669791|nr:MULTISPECIES: hypothetical protein [unclassified Oceanicaulis]EAP89539.1 hypothetical protein OA2633_09744 [Oceanicaulis sp. HTCC2633]MBC38788.1 hypothetical protein [Oceanicaulis sp.]MBG36242.1 hypothetical protein [Oceanicaulis sp.]HBU63678.1 hypothetical protein [Oceanicaulis sp.]|tara:strand:+ start:2023 stop:2343 length:321 start_codon:yes stop_codon:yes gene_type:complete
MTTGFRIIAALGAIALAFAIVWAGMTAGQSLSEAVGWLVSEPWGVVSLIDLYLGFVLIAILIWVFEPNKLIALAFILPLPILGNVWSAVWLAWRLGALINRRRAGD